MKIIPKEEKEEKLKLGKGDVIKGIDPINHHWGYFMVCKSSDERYCLVNISKDKYLAGGELTTDGIFVANLGDFVEDIDYLIAELRDVTGYTDIQKVTLEAREV